MKDNLKQTSYDFSIVLNENELTLFKSETNLLKKICESDYFDINICSVIKHDQDIDDETNQIKTLHYHIAMRTNRKLQISSVINHISDIFHCNKNQISVKKLTSLESYTRYLIHLDDADKHQYCPFDIITNNQLFVNECLSKNVIRDEKHCLSLLKTFHYSYEKMITSCCNWKRYNSLIKDFIRMRNI